MAETREIDLLDGDFYVTDTYENYAWLRQNAPVYWDATNELWGIFGYDDIVEIEKAKTIFINSDRNKGGYRPNLPADPSIIGSDDPLHLARRNLVSRRFTPRAVTRWEDHIRDVVAHLIDAALEHPDDVEIVEELAAPLPAMMIGLLLGFPDEAWPKLRDWSERTIVGGGGPRYATEDVITAAMEFAGECAHLYEEKRACPADDVMSVWVQAPDEVGGAPFGLDQVLSDCLLLLDGGAETTRTVIARTILNLIANPGEWAKLKQGADLTVAVEEFIRYVSPVHNMCRVATQDYELRGQTIRQGQQVVLMYGSANRDEAHFTDPETFDVTRHPNHHIAFGFGTHFCLGASLARLEIRLFFEELVRRVQSLELVAGIAPVEMPNPFVYGLKSAHVRFS